MFSRLYVVLFLLASVSALEEYSNLGSCKENTVAYKIHIDSAGKPELICTEPFCFNLATPTKNPENKTCGGFVDDGGCLAPNEVVGRIMEVKDGAGARLKTSCCSYPEVAEARKVQVISLIPGDQFTGGVYVGQSGWEGFDLIKDVRRVQDEKQITFEILVVRMPCQPSDADKSVHPQSAEELISRPFFPPIGRRRSPLGSTAFRRNLNLLNDYYYDYYEDQDQKPSSAFGYEQVVPRVLTEQQLPAGFPTFYVPMPAAPPTEKKLIPLPFATLPERMVEPLPSSTAEPTTKTTSPGTTGKTTTTEKPTSTEETTTTEEPTTAEESTSSQPARSFSPLIIQKDPKRIWLKPRWDRQKGKKVTTTTEATAESSTEVPHATEAAQPTTAEKHTLSPLEELSLRNSFVQLATK